MNQQTQYKVVVNDEEQYSTWLASRPAPAGWYETGHSGTEEECLDHIGRVWSEILPRSGRTSDLTV